MRLLVLITVLGLAVAGLYGYGAESITSNNTAEDKQMADPEQVNSAQATKTKRFILPNKCPFTYIGQDEWDKFLVYIAGGGKWIFVNFYHDKDHLQHRTAFVGDKIVMTAPISGAMKSQGKEIDAFKNNNPQKCHNHLGIYKIYLRSKNYTSRQYNCSMRYSLFYHGGHALHATTPGYYALLGKPASHGCIRQSLNDAKDLFEWAGKDEVLVLACRTKGIGEIIIE